MSTQQNKETTQKEETKKIPFWATIASYLLSVTILAGSIYLGNIQLDKGLVVAQSEALDRDNSTFIAIFIFLTGILGFVTAALCTYVLSREKKKNS